MTAVAADKAVDPDAREDKGAVGGAKASDKELGNGEEAQDSLRVLPLSIVPLDSAALQRANLIKNVALDSVIEFFKDKSAGSGQVLPEQLAQFLGWPRGEPHADLDTVQRLARLNSFDVYSLRIELRKVGISVNSHAALRLSEEKSAELAGYMKTFTAPLIQRVFGSANPDINDYDQLIGMFRSPDREEAMRNLTLLAESLNVELVEVPSFLEDYGDTFLSLAYFRKCLDDVVPKVMNFLEGIIDLRSNHQLKNTPGFVAACDFMEPRLNSIITSMTGRFESFERNTQNMWDNLSAASFQNVRKMITAHHATLGGVLCGLTVKMDAWEEKFGKVPQGAAVIRRSEFIMGDMRRGVDKIENIEASAPKIGNA